MHFTTPQIGIIYAQQKENQRIYFKVNNNYNISEITLHYFYIYFLVSILRVCKLTHEQHKLLKSNEWYDTIILFYSLV